ncbi:MAG: ABC transporter substrate-binding protein [Chloroflexota bacterium]|nr:ABC transporter substrate-binding protein [Chloroflexota bacterium]
MRNAHGLTRRRLMAAVGVLALVGAPGLAGAQGTPVATPAADASAFPVTISHDFWETTIPALPQRIVVTNQAEGLDSLLALGVLPVGMVQGRAYIEGLAPWVIAAGGEEIPVIPGTAEGELDFEAITAARPDLILTSWPDDPTYQTLSSIAPTLVFKNSDAITWQDVQRLTGEATGRGAQAEQVIADTEALVASQEERLQPYLDQQVAVAYFWFDQFFVNGKDAPIGRILAAYGMDVISPGTVAPGQIDALSLEQINAVADADIIIAPDFLADQTAAQEANPLFRALPEVQNGGYVLLSPEMAQALYIESALSTQWAVPRLVDAVIAGAEGKGKLLD